MAVVTRSRPARPIRVDSGGRIPAGGTSGQALVKSSDNDYAIEWGAATAAAAWGAITGTLSAQTDLQSALDAKQAALVSGTNIKTVNGTTILGSGDLVVSGGITDGDKGDITVSGSGATWTIDAGAVTVSNMADMATASLIYRKTAGTGVPEVNTLATLKTDLGLTGTNSGDQTIALTGDVTGSGTGSFAATIASGAVSLSKMANLAASTFIGNNTGSPATPIALTVAQAKTLLAIIPSDVSGLAAVATSGSATDLSTGTLAAARLPAFGSGDVSFAASGGAGTIAANAVTNAKAAQMATATFKGRVTAGTGNPEDMTGTQATALLDVATTSLKGLAPQLSGVSTEFLNGTGAFSTPAGGGGFDFGLNAAMSGLTTY